jgi:hypothetical protein
MAASSGGFAAQFDFKLGGGGRRGAIVGDVCPAARGLGLEVWKRWWWRARERDLVGGACRISCCCSEPMGPIRKPPICLSRTIWRIFSTLFAVVDMRARERDVCFLRIWRLGRSLCWDVFDGEGLKLWSLKTEERSSDLGICFGWDVFDGEGLKLWSLKTEERSSDLGICFGFSVLFLSHSLGWQARGFLKFGFFFFLSHVACFWPWISLKWSKPLTGSY